MSIQNNLLYLQTVFNYRLKIKVELNNVTAW